MVTFFKKIFYFIALIITILYALYIVDVYFFDRISNDFLIDAVNNDISENKLIVIGSSKLKWGIVDTLLSNTTFLSEGGQFTYGSMAVLLALDENKKLINRSIIIDLEEANEISAGFGQWWYFSEAFLQYRYASFMDFPVRDWPFISARIIRDLTHFAPNHQRVFVWKSIETINKYKNSKVDTLIFNKIKNDYLLGGSSFSVPFKNSLVRINYLFNKLEIKNSCKIYVLIPPFPKSGTLKDYEEIFGKNRVFNMATKNFVSSDFHDNSHLNKEGAIKLTKSLIDSLQIRQSPQDVQ